MADLEKYDRLKEILKSYESVAVAFSGGVDSTFLLYAAKDALGEKAIAVTATADFVPNREKNEAEDFCISNGIKQIVCSVNFMDIEHFSENPSDRCYFCKKHIFTKLIAAAKENGIKEVAEGSNLDDNSDYRPGHRAIAELMVKSPLRDAGLTKKDIRELSEYFGLPTWNKPSFACLASRVPYGETITSDKLSMVEKAEDYLLLLGFTQFRVRVHGEVARIELMPQEFHKIMEDNVRQNVYDELIKVGFKYVSLDLKGYRTGSLNEVL